MAFLNAFGQEFLQRWKNVSFGQKLVVGMLAFSSIVVIVVLALWASKADLGLLYSGLDPKDAAEVVNELDAAKVPYELRDGGTTVMASVDNVYALWLRMASKGLPRGTAGFEIFEKPNLGVTDFVQQVNYVRALQGELARTIGSLQQVEWARVMIARPEKSLFIEDAKEPTASVVIKTRSGRPLSENQLAGVTHLVAGSVEGLEPGNVVITDDRGNLLSKGAQSSLTATMSSHLDAQRQLEDYLASKAQAMLERVLGPGRSIVKVSADLDMRKTSETKVEYGKDANKLPRRMSSRTTTTSRAPSGGVAGTAANVPPAATATGGTGTVSSDTEETTEYYEPLSHTEVATVNEPGQTKRLSVAAFINGGSYKVTKSPDGTESRQYQPMDDAQKGTFEKIIMQAGRRGGRARRGVQHAGEHGVRTGPTGGELVHRPGPGACEVRLDRAGGWHLCSVRTPRVEANRRRHCADHRGECRARAPAVSGLGASSRDRADGSQPRGGRRGPVRAAERRRHHARIAAVASGEHS